MKPNVNVIVGGFKNPVEYTYKTIILKSNLPFAEQVTDSWCIYVIKWDFDLGSSIVEIPDNCVLKFEGGGLSNGIIIGNDTSIEAGLVKIFGSDTSLEGSWSITEAYPEWFGAKGDGVTDDNLAFSSIAASPFKNIKLKEKSCYISSGTIHFNKDVNIDGNGSKIKFTVENTGYTGLIIAKDEVLTELTNITSIEIVIDSEEEQYRSYGNSENIIRVNSVDGLSKGDVIMLVDTEEYSWSPERAYYLAGDIFKISDIVGNNIVTSERATQNYSGSSLKLFKINTLDVCVKNIEIEGHYEGTTYNKTVPPLVINGCENVVIDNVKTCGANNANLFLVHCYGGNVSNFYCYEDCPVTQSSITQYGIQLSVCKNIVVTKSNVTATRHAIAIGGGTYNPYTIPSRYITISDSVFDTLTNMFSVDSHGPGQFITVTGCHIKNGVIFECSDFVLSNNRIESYSTYYTVLIQNNVYPRGVISGNTIKGNMLQSQASITGIIVTNKRLDNNNPTNIRILENTIEGYGLGSSGINGRRHAICVLGSLEHGDGSVVDIINNRFNYITDIYASGINDKKLTVNIEGNHYITLLAKDFNIVAKNNEIVYLETKYNPNIKLFNNTIYSNSSIHFEKDSVATLIGNNIVLTADKRSGYIVCRGGQYIQIEDNMFTLKEGLRVSYNAPIIIVDDVVENDVTTEVETAIVRRNNYLLKNSQYAYNIINANLKVLDYGGRGDLPSAPYVKVGDSFFATDIQKPLFWSNDLTIGEGGWVDADGNNPNENNS